MTGNHLGKLVAATGGAFMGAFEVLHSDAEAKRRDAGAGATLMGPMLGPAKLAAGIASMVGAGVEHKGGKFLLGAASGAALGATMALLHATTGSVLHAALLSGAIGGISPLVGPRLMQGTRNLSADVGRGLNWVGQKSGILAKPLDPKISNVAGSIPVGLTRTLALSGGSFKRAGISLGMKMVHEGYTMYFARPERKPTNPPPAAKST
jgi:hypothetical protein